jgi:hypothetical protein
MQKLIKKKKKTRLPTESTATTPKADLGWL